MATFTKQAKKQIKQYKTNKQQKNNNNKPDTETQQGAAEKNKTSLVYYLKNKGKQKQLTEYFPNNINMFVRSFSVQFWC